ncbi:hypothetical protein LTR17_014138 [Elasticomyces elasticus]|nr:hypothetical protein LTR17_014138 [Elasticomyces elasticus]
MAHRGYDRVDPDDSEREEMRLTSMELRREDEETLHAEEDAEELLARSEKVPTGSRREHEARLGRKKRGQPEKREMMYDTEEGGLRSSSDESSGHSSEVDLVRLGETQAGKKAKRRRYCGFAAVHILIVLAFLGLLYGAWRVSNTSHSKETEKGQSKESIVSTSEGDVSEASGKLAESTYTPQTLSNGTHTFAPTTLLISLDGFRADFLHRNLTKTLASFMRQGVSPKYMLPSFPSLTFPNHFTLVTGLHPESHGIVGNTFWSTELEKEFHYTDPARSMQAEWWDAEPIWVTAEKAGLQTGIHMWPGSEVTGGIEGVKASYVDHFNGDEHLGNKINRILGWLDLPGSLDAPGAAGQELRPQLIAAYVPDVDSDGHKYGPNSTYIKSTIAEVDGMLGSLFDGIARRNLTDIVNIIIVSDHGMATTSVSRLIQLEDLIDTSLIEHTDGWPLYGLRPYDSSPEKLLQLYTMLLEQSKLPKYKHAFEVYLRDKDMPERFHFSNNDRIAPLWLVPKAGWAIVVKDEFDVAASIQSGEVYHPLGLHGYDNHHPLMRAMFVARGPAFPHIPGSELAPFQNTEVYNIVCDSLGLKPVANNGTLRLPLKPSGLHDFNQAADVPEDPQDDAGLALPPEVPNLAYQHDGAHTSLPPEVPNLANRPENVLPTAGVPPVSSVHWNGPALLSTPTPAAKAAQSATSSDAEAENEPTRPIVHDGVTDGEDDGKVNRWWDWVTGKLDAIKDWGSGLLGKGKDNADTEQPNTEDNGRAENVAKRSNTKRGSAQVTRNSLGARPATKLTGKVTTTSRRSILKRKAGDHEGPRLMPQKWAQIQLLHNFVHVDVLDRLVQAEATVSDLSDELACFKQGLMQLCEGHGRARSKSGADIAEDDNESEVSTDVEEVMNTSKRGRLASVPKKQALPRKNKQRASGTSATVRNAKKVSARREVYASTPKSKSKQQNLVARRGDANVDESSLLSILSEDAMSEAGEALRRDQEAMRLGRGSVKPL